MSNDLNLSLINKNAEDFNLKQLEKFQNNLLELLNRKEIETLEEISAINLEINHNENKEFLENHYLELYLEDLKKIKENLIRELKKNLENLSKIINKTIMENSMKKFHLDYFRDIFNKIFKMELNEFEEKNLYGIKSFLIEKISNNNKIILGFEDPLSKNYSNIISNFLIKNYFFNSESQNILIISNLNKIINLFHKKIVFLNQEKFFTLIQENNEEFFQDFSFIFFEILEEFISPEIELNFILFSNFIPIEKKTLIFITNIIHGQKIFKQFNNKNEKIFFFNYKQPRRFPYEIIYSEEKLQESIEDKIFNICDFISNSIPQANILIITPSSEFSIKISKLFKQNFPNFMINMNYNKGKKNIILSNEKIKNHSNKIYLINNLEDLDKSIQFSVVIDTGFFVQQNFVNYKNIHKISFEKISKYEANRRFLTLNENSPSFCYRLYSQKFFNKVMKKINVKSFNIDFCLLRGISILNDEFFQKKSLFGNFEQSKVKNCLELCQILGVYKEKKITSLGKELICYPFNFIYSLILIESIKNGVYDFVSYGISYQIIQEYPFIVIYFSFYFLFFLEI